MGGSNEVRKLGSAGGVRRRPESVFAAMGKFLHPKAFKLLDIHVLDDVMNVVREYLFNLDCDTGEFLLQPDQPREGLSKGIQRCSWGVEARGEPNGKPQGLLGQGYVQILGNGMDGMPLIRHPEFHFIARGMLDDGPVVEIEHRIPVSAGEAMSVISLDSNKLIFGDAVSDSAPATEPLGVLRREEKIRVVGPHALRTIVETHLNGQPQPDPESVRQHIHSGVILVNFEAA